jgi:hypothetical protein
MPSSVCSLCSVSSSDAAGGPAESISTGSVAAGGFSGGSCVSDGGFGVFLDARVLMLQLET